MNKVNGRKVLISFNLSTLLLIVLGVLISTMIVVNVCTKHKEKEIASATKIEVQEIEEIQVDEDEVTTVALENYERKEVITSRSSEGRDMMTIINPEEILAEQAVEEVVEVSTPIEEVTISVDMDLTVRTGLSRDDFIILMRDLKADTSGFFEENAGLIYDACERYSINEIFFVGLMSAESGWNIASNHRRTYNYISLMGSNGLIRFESVEDGIEKAAKTLHDRYLTPGGSCYYGPTLSGVKTRFCPASSTWVGLVFGRMQQVIK